jgi:WD40 repeat protein
MAEFTDVEKQLLERVTDDRLRVSLAEIRQAAEDIWADDAPRIIQDYTDHGIAHSERLAGFAAKLLVANDGRDLSAQEMYLLLAGIYLHDIGMQCDVVQFPEVRERAEVLGAQFDIEFTAETASGYSIDEQKAIRRNHQYLAAAWIDHANRTGATVLGPAAKTIPEDLVDDLMDVCKHHAKLPITDCPLTFTFDPTGRKQLVAALLRFADELDVDGHRVSIETVKNFRLDPRNSAYWWLHNRTKVVFSARNVILLAIRLHPDDVKQHGPFVHAAFITEFQTKNRPVVTVLAQNGIPIVISADSKVVEQDRAEPLPQEIVQALQTMQEKRDPLTELADEVRTWLQAIRYEVSEPQRRDDRTVEMLATLDLGTVKQRVLVRCIGGEITHADVDALDEVLDRKTPQGWLISDKRVSDRARARAAQDDAFQVFTLADFLRQMVWGPYFDALTSLAERDHIPDLYVDLGCYKQEMAEEGREIGRDQYASLDAYMDGWLTERGKMHISLLGEFGTGKTWFCRHYAYRQLECYLADPVNERLPLLITLRAFAKAMNAQQLINDALLEQYKLPFVGSAFQVFQEMNRRGKLLLILDGFDEMARQVDYQTVVDNFWTLAELVDENSKVILTSRTEYFRWAKESEKVLGGEEFGRRTIVLSPPKFEVLHLEPFSDDQIREVITRRLGAEEGPAVAARILGAPNLAEMARKPVLVELLLAALDEVSADVLENPAQVYLYATNRLLLRNIDTQRTFTTTADKLYFLCELAWEMVKSGELRIHYTDIPERIKTYFGDRIKNQHELDTWDFDLRAQTLLHRDAAGYYEFAHKSLAEYFVAYEFAAELGCLASAFAQTYCEANGQPCQLPIKQKDMIGLTETFGAMALTDARMETVRDLLQEMIAEDATRRLWEVIDETRGKTSEQVKYAGGNAATLLQMQGASFKGANLARTVLAGASLFNTDLTGSDLQRARLRAVTLSGCKLEDADLRDADLTDIRVYELNSVFSVAWSPDGQWLASGGNDGNVWIWKTSFKENPIVLRGHRSGVSKVRWASKKAILASGSFSDGILLWDAVSFQKIGALSTETGLVLALDFSPDYTHMVSGAYDLSIWDIDTQSKHLEIDARAYYDAKYDPIGEHIAIAGRSAFEHTTVAIYEAATGVLIEEWQTHQHHTRCVEFLDSNELVTVSYEEKPRVWRGNQLEFEIPTDKLPRSLIADTGRKLVFIGCENGDIEIWSIPGPVRQGKLEGHRSGVIALSLSQDSRYLASGSSDATIRIWEAEPDSPTFGQCLKVLEAQMNCREMQIGGARGLEQEMKWRVGGEKRKGTLLEFFADRGAVLDEEQKLVVEEARERRESGDRRT